MSLALVVILAGPVLAVTGQILQADRAGVLDPIRHAALLTRTTAFAASVTVGSMALGLAAASILWTRKPGAVHLVAIALLSLVAVPPYLHVLAWRSLAGAFDRAGEFSGWGAAWWVQVMAMAPIAAGLALLGLSGVDARLIRAARMSRPDGEVYFRVALPLAAPALKAAAAVIFLFTMTDYAVAQSFQRDTYAFEIFAEFSASHDAGRASLVALPVVVLSLAVLFVLLRQLEHLSVTPVTAAAELPLRFAPPGRLAMTAGLTLLVVQGLALVAGLGIEIPGMAGLLDTMAGAARGVAQSAGIAALAACIALPLSFAAANRILGGGWSGRVWLVLSMLPLALPGPLIGIGLVVLWNRPAVAWVYDSGAVLVLTGLVRFLPLAVLVAMAGLLRVDRVLLDAARVHASGRLRGWGQIRAPLLLPAGVAEMFLVFTLSLAELPASLLTAPAGSESLAARIYGYLHYGASDRVAALSLVLPVLAALAALALAICARAWRLVLPRRPWAREVR